MVDMVAMEKRRKLAALDEDRALRRADSAMANAEAHLETAPWVVLLAFCIGVGVGAAVAAVAVLGLIR